MGNLWHGECARLEGSDSQIKRGVEKTDGDVACL